MKRRIRALKAIILVAIMVVELFGVESLRTLAADITLTDDTTIINSDDSNNYDLYYHTLTVSENGNLTGVISGSGGMVVNSGRINKISCDGTTTVKNNAGASIESVSGASTITNAGTINTLSCSYSSTLTLAGGTVNSLTSPYSNSIEVTGAATVGTLSGAFDITGTGTMTVTNKLNLTRYNTEPSCTIEVTDDTSITVASRYPITVTYGANTYTLTEGTDQTLSDLKGNTISATLSDSATMTQTTAFLTGKFLNGQTVTANYTAKDGYYFPEEYGSAVTEDGEGDMAVTRTTDGKNITVTYTFREERSDVTITLPAATAKGTQTAPTVTGGVNTVSGATNEMEYADSESAITWTPVSDDGQVSITGPKTVYFRYKETDTLNASPTTSVTVLGEGQATLAVSNVYFGKTPTPTATSTTNTGVTPTIEYKKSTDEDTAYSTTVPTAVGTYTVRAKYSATTQYGEAIATKEFEIRYLEAPSPAYTLVGTPGSNGYYTSTVTVNPATGYTISTTQDGTYEASLTVDASQAASNIYLKNAADEKTGAISLESIKIDKSAPELNVVDETSYVVENQTLKVTDANLYRVTVNGAEQTISGTEFEMTLTESADDYVIVAEDKAGNSASATIHVERATQAAPSGVKGGVEEVSGVSTDMEYAESETATTWTAVTAIKDAIAKTMDMVKGTWYFRYKATTDKKASEAVSVKVLGEGTGTVTVADVNYGGTINPQPVSATNGTEAVTYQYKKATEADSAYSDTVPTAIGSYTVKATFAATDDYSEATATATFAIKYLTAPNPAYTLEGTEGNNGYYTTAVTVKPVAGYTISGSLGGTYSASLTINATQAAGSIYLKNAAGEMTDAIPLEAIQIDKAKPQMDVEDGETYFVQTKSITITDETALSKVSINGVAQTVSGASFTKALAESTEDYVIVAEDTAGNSTSATIHVERATQAAPSGLVGGGEEVSGVSTDMEYAASETATTWTAVTTIKDAIAKTMDMAKGTWYFRYKETDTKKASESVAVLVKGKGTGTVTVADVNYGGTINPQPQSATNGTEAVTYQYKKKTEGNSAYTATPPTAIGTYVVKATFAENDTYGPVTATAEFKIQYLKAPALAYTLEGTKGKDGYYTSDVVIKPAQGYTVSKSLGGTYSEKLTVKASQAAGKIYLKNVFGEMTDAIALEAIKIDADAPVFNVNDGKTYATKKKEVTVTDNNLSSVTVNGTAQKLNGKTLEMELAESEKAYEIVAEDKAGNSVTVSIHVARNAQEAPTELVGGEEEVLGVTTAMEYAQSKDAQTWTAVKEVSASGSIKLEKGTWYFRFKETNSKHESPAVAVKVKGISRKPGTGSIKVQDIYYGANLSVKVVSNTNDANQAVTEYKTKGASDAAYTTQAPTQAGAYTVRATLPQTDKYETLILTQEFSISYLPIPEKPYSLTGTQGKNGYYLSDVVVTPAKGYLIATQLDGDYQNTLTISESMEASKLYLKKEATGEKTAGVDFEAVKIKREVPKVSLEDGETYYGDTKQFDIQDPYLKQVYVNGVAQNPTGTTFNLELSANHGRTRYEIVAEDEAGNRKTIVVFVAATWMKTGLVPAGTLVNLEAGNGYKLGAGSWRVAGDATSYNGNTTFFVRQNGSFTFEQQ